MKTLLHKIRDTAAKSAVGRRESGPIDDETNASSSSSHGSAAQFTQGKRSRSNTHSIRPPKLRVDLANAKTFSPPPPPAQEHTPYWSTPSLVAPPTPRSASRFRKHRDPAPLELPTQDPNRFAALLRNDDPVSPLRRDSELSSTTTSAKAVAPKNEKPDSANTIRTCRSFRENSFAAFNVFKDKSGSTTAPDHAVLSSNEIAPHESDPALGSGFSTFTMVTNDSHQQVVRLVSNADLVLDGLKDGNSSGGSATSLAHIVGEDDTRNRYRQLLGAPSPAPTVPTSRSRARTVLQRLRRPLTAGSTRANEDAASPPPTKVKTFGARKASFAENPTDRSVSATLPATTATAADMAVGQSYSSLDFDRADKHQRGRPPVGERRRAVPISQRAASAHAAHAPGMTSNMRIRDDAATRQISRLVADLLRTGRKPSDPAFGEDIFAKAALIVSMAERTADEGSHLPQTPVSASGPRRPSAANATSSPSSLTRGIDRLESAVISYIRKSGHSFADLEIITLAFAEARRLCSPIEIPSSAVSSGVPNDVFHTGLTAPAPFDQSQLDQDAVIRSRMGTDIVSANVPPLTPTSSKGLSPRELPQFLMPLSPTSPPQQQQHPSTPATPSAAELSSLALASRGPTAARGKDADKESAAVSPFESQLSQTSEKDLGMSLTPAPRRRRRPTTAPETGGGIPSPFGTPARLAREIPVPALESTAGAADERSNRQDGTPLEERRPSIIQLDNSVSAVNRRSFVHQASHSYSAGQVPSEDLDADIHEGGQVEMLLGTDTPDLSIDGGNGQWKQLGWGSGDGRNTTADVKETQHFSRPSTASSATTLSAQPPPQLFTPESFSWRAESRSSTNTPYLRPEASSSQTSFTMPPIGTSSGTGAGAANVPGPGLGIRFGLAGGDVEHLLKPKSSRKFGAGGDASSRRDLMSSAAAAAQELQSFGHSSASSAQIYG